MGRAELRKRTRPLLIAGRYLSERLAALMSETKGVVGAYVFGSLAGDRFDPQNSDADIAVLTMERFSETSYLRLEERVALVVGSDRFDLIWLNRADPVVCFNVISTGRLVACHDDLAVNAFERRMLHEHREFLYRLQRRREWRQHGS